MNARSVGLELIQLARDVSRQAEKGFEAELFDVEEQPPIEEMERLPVHSKAQHLVGRLFSDLSEDRWEPEKLDEEVPAQESWSFGWVHEYGELRRIRNGYLEPFRIVPLVKNLPKIVVQFLITLPGGSDHLDREHHKPVGWHYHYLDRTKRRSDVILCWDTRWPGAKAPSRSALRPLFQERHGEGRAKFPAKPNRWRAPKRESMHDACAPDLQRWALSEFRCAANKAEAVWPRGSALTPRV